ncbi:MAG: RdgB/HAM1 family non-canonical purine NTP pyrophosphatase [Ignavibacteriae bacterium]|nr:RdgB/HAM1 family non-canonical purine NTP pyrophosphatase [Ignavibacteriota bacterium]
MKKLVLATRNKHKIAELQTLLKGLNLELLTLNDFPNHPPLIEDGTTFQENALKKARTIFAHTKLPTLADDSGLEVFFINGRPGIHSARYAHEQGGKAEENSPDEKNNEKLLAEMRGVAPRRRRAVFKAVLALVGPGYEKTAEGICPGRLGESPRGTNGFGYDPIFIPDGHTKTFAELGEEEKNKIGHRARAVEKMREVIEKRI